MKIEVGQIIKLDIGPRIRVYQVVGVYLGSSKEENVIGLKCLDKKPSPEVQTSRANDEMLVPECFVELVICQEGSIVMPLDVQKRCAGLDEKTETLKSKPFVWFNMKTFNFSKISGNITTYENRRKKLIRPINCVPVRVGTIIDIFKSKYSDRVHLCIGGRVLKEDNKLGLFCKEDFNNEDYVKIMTTVAKV